MDKVFVSLTTPFKVKTGIDNFVFKLHYRVTFAILIAASLVVTAKSYIGDPIECISKDDIPIKLLNTFCWIHSTFSIESAWFKKIGEDVPYPGVDKYFPGEERVYHAYYQWVCFVLFLQAIFFYLPHYFWKRMEGQRLKNMASVFDPLVVKKKDKEVNLNILVKYLNNCGKNLDFYFFWYIVAQVWNFINVIAQMYIINTFLGGEFIQYGTKVLNFTDWDWKLRYDPMLRVFPRMTKCTFHRFGSSGDVQRHDALCLLPVNIISEKIYVFVWFWFVFLAVVTGLELVYRAAALLFEKVRYHVIRSRAGVTDESHLKFVVTRCKPGSWFVLSLLSKNLDPSHFRVLIAEMYYTITETKC